MAEQEWCGGRPLPTPADHLLGAWSASTTGGRPLVALVAPADHYYTGRTLMTPADHLNTIGRPL
jgi:hypothetical protein